MDPSGRVVVPKPIRDRLSLRGGEEFDVIERDGVIEMWPTPLEADAVVIRDGPVAVPRTSLPTLTAEMVRETLERVRR